MQIVRLRDVTCTCIYDTIVIFRFKIKFCALFSNNNKKRKNQKLLNNSASHRKRPEQFCQMVFSFGKKLMFNKEKIDSDATFETLNCESQIAYSKRYRKQFWSLMILRMCSPRDFNSWNHLVCVSKPKINKRQFACKRTYSFAHPYNTDGTLYNLVVYIRWKSFTGEKAYMRPSRRSCGSMELTDTHITGINDTRSRVYGTCARRIWDMYIHTGEFCARM